jgi:hypothetical protein
MTNYPLAWPNGWKRTKPGQRRSAKFSKRIQRSSGTGETYQSWSNKSEVTISEGTKRVLEQLRSMGVREGDAIISTDLKVRLDGLPYSSQKEPENPGVAVYWKKGKEADHKVIAIDLYTRIADNLAAIAATLGAMRAIERHGGAVIMERAFSGFLSLPAPNTWRAVMGYQEDAGVSLDRARADYRDLSKQRHPDCGGSDAAMAELNWAMAEAEKELA